MEIITTREAYEDAIKSIQSGSDFEFEFGDGSVFLDHGWKARVEVIANTRNRTHYLYIKNDRFGFPEAKMMVTQWKRIEAEYISTYMKSYKTYDCTYENVKACLSLLLISCNPKNFSDYPNIIQDEWIHLGFYFCRDLFNLVKTVVNESDWKDWGPYWKSKYYRLLRSMGEDEGKVPEDEDQDIHGNRQG